ncbi:MAG: CpaF family protein [Acidimicrobiia bacterium]
MVDDVFRAIDGPHAPAASQVLAEVQRSAPLLGPAARRAVADAVLARRNGFGPLGPLFDDPDIAEIMVNGAAVWIERHGCLQRTDVQLDAAAVERLVERIVGPAGARVDRASPIADVRLPDGSRVNIVLPPAAPDGPLVTIRKFVLRSTALESFCGADVAALLADAVGRRTNLVVSGGTGSGKTTLLNALASHIPGGERVVTIEDTAELRLQHPHVVRLESRRPNSEGTGSLTIRQLLRTALRMRPDRILVGEARGDEVMDMLQAMNSGHEGSMSTCHANTPRDALRRLEALALLGGDRLSLPFIRDQLQAALRLVVHVQRLPGGARRVQDVVALAGDADWASGRGLTPVVIDGVVPARRLGSGDSPHG